jgi:hypothetical protein
MIITAIKIPKFSFQVFIIYLIAFSPAIIHSYPIMNCQLYLIHLIVFKGSGEVAANGTLLTMKFRVYSL